MRIQPTIEKTTPAATPAATPVATADGACAPAVTCNQCHHTISRTGAPWDRAWRCSERCSCAMMIGCVPVRVRPRA